MIFKTFHICDLLLISFKELLYGASKQIPRLIDSMEDLCLYTEFINK